MARTIDDATKPPANVGEEIPFAKPVDQAPQLPTGAPRFNALSLGPPNEVLGTDSDWRAQFYRAGVPSERIPPLPPQASIAKGAAAQSLIDTAAAGFSGNALLLMPKEYFVQNQSKNGKLIINVSWVDELAETALMGPQQSIITTFFTPYFNVAAGPLDFSGASGTVTFSFTLGGWVQDTIYAKGALIVDSNNNVQRATTGGTSHHGSAPSFGTVVGATTTDGSVTWTCVKYLITIGDTIIFSSTIDPSASGLSAGPATITSATDNRGNTYQTFITGGSFNNGVGRLQSVQAFYAVAQQNVSYGTTLAISGTVTGGSSDSITAIQAGLFSNLGAIGTAITQSSGPVSSWSSGSLTISDHQILISVSGSGVTEILGGGSPFTLAYGSGGLSETALAYYNPGVAGTHADSWQTSSGSAYVSSGLVAFLYKSTTTVAVTSGTPGFRYIFNSDLSHAVFGAAGDNHQVGAVPDPGAAPNNSLFLRSDATWAEPPAIIEVNGNMISGQTPNFGTTPAAPAGNAQVLFQDDTSTPVTNVSASVAPFGASGASHAPGAVPDPGAVAGTARFLREDATFAVPTGANGSVQVNGTEFSDDYIFTCNAEPQVTVNGA